MAMGIEHNEEAGAAEAVDILETLAQRLRLVQVGRGLRRRKEAAGARPDEDVALQALADGAHGVDDPLILEADEKKKRARRAREERQLPLHALAWRGVWSGSPIHGPAAWLPGEKGRRAR
jgi:hypothetical protein